MRMRLLALRALPWLLLAAMTGFAAIGWVHFIAKDQALWQRSFETVHASTARVAQLDEDDIASVREALIADREAQCDYIARYADHIPHELADALAAARAVCDTPIPPPPAPALDDAEDYEEIEAAPPENGNGRANGD